MGLLKQELGTSDLGKGTYSSEIEIRWEKRN